MNQLAGARLYLLFTPELCAGEPWSTLASAMTNGVDLVQWRPVQPRRGRRGELERCHSLCAAHGIPLLVNDEPELAVAIDAAGAHVGQDDMPAPAARAILGPHRWLGVSTHDLAQIAAATRAGADYIGFGPCFPTATKGYTEALAGRGDLARALAAATVPVFAIGGITVANVHAVVAAGGTRIAVTASVLGADDPGAAARALRVALDRGAP